MSLFAVILTGLSHCVVAVAGTGDELTRPEARCVHCGAPGSIRDFLKEGQYCSPQCAVVNARKYVRVSC